MIPSIQHFFAQFVVTDDAEAAESPHAVRVATAALLVEMAYADHTYSSDEQQALHENIKLEFQLTQAESEQLLQLAMEKKDGATCLYEFTRLINQTFTKQQKITVIEMLWRVAFADKVLDRHEEHLVRKVADLLHVRHKELIQAKHRIFPKE